MAAGRRGQALIEALPDELVGDTISLDTKHILAWVRENNPKAYVSERFNPEPTRRRPRLPAGLQAPQQHARRRGAPAGQRGQQRRVLLGLRLRRCRHHLADGTEIVLAELTQTFDLHDITYFQPLMAQPSDASAGDHGFGALDAAFDAFYVYDYFHQAGGFAAVPWWPAVA